MLLLCLCGHHCPGRVGGRWYLAPYSASLAPLFFYYFFLDFILLRIVIVFLGKFLLFFPPTRFIILFL